MGNKIKEIVYATSTPIAREPYTHRLVGRVLAAAQRRGYHARIKAVDTREAMDGTLLMQLARRGEIGADAMQLEAFSSPLRGVESDSILFFSGVLDYWRVTLRNPRMARNCRKLLWFQGLESEESYLKHGSRFRRGVLAAAEARALRGCDGIICPSDAMIDTLTGRYPSLRGNSFFTVPNLADGILDVQADPVLWGFEQRPELALGYMGGLSTWQCFEETCRIVREVQERVPGCWFLVLTRETELAETLLARNGVMRYRIRSAATEDTPKYVSAFDFGFMLRREHIVNRVACPMKWLEYWQCGIPLITTGAVEIISQAPCSDCNLCVDLQDVRGAAVQVVRALKRVTAERGEIQTRLRECVKNAWTWDRGLGIVEDIVDLAAKPRGHAVVRRFCG